MSDQSIPAEPGILAPHTFVALTALLAGWTHGLHGLLAALLVALGAAADLNRYPWSREVRIGPLTLPVRSYVPPRRVWLAMALMSVFLSVIWWKVPSACWPALDGLVDREFGIAAMRFHRFTDLCEVPHGVALALTQVVVPFLTVGICALYLHSSQLDAARWLADTPSSLQPIQSLPSAQRRLPQWKVLLFASVIGGLGACVPFTYDPAGHARSLAPQLGYLHFLKWLGPELGSSLAFASLMAARDALLQQEP